MSPTSSNPNIHCVPFLPGTALYPFSTEKTNIFGIYPPGLLNYCKLFVKNHVYLEKVPKRSDIILLSKHAGFKIFQISENMAPSFFVM